MSGQSGGYVRAVFNFDTSEPGEIALCENDVVQALCTIDDNWLYGNLYGQCGNFPANFVEPLVLPNVDDLQKLFVGTKDFQAEVDGDLGFHRGDIIIGLEPVDENWWNGMMGNETGIFPITHVFELVEAEAPADVAPPCEHVAPPSVSGDIKVIATVQASMDLTAQLDDELGFHIGDIIQVVEVVDSDFGIGQLNGKTGSFPLAFVELVSGSLHLEMAKTGEDVTQSKFEWWKEEGKRKEDNVNKKVQEKCEDIGNDNLQSPEFEPEFKAPVACSEKTSLASNFKPSHKRNRSYNQINISSYDVTISAYGKAKYPFLAENDNELSFFDNDIILLTRHIDDEWMEGELDGRRGIFPTSYIDIIVDCMDVNESPNSVIDTSKPVDGTSEEIEVYGRVLYDFHAESSNELALTEGDTVTVLKKIDDDWIEVKHDDGRTGCCPVSYVELIRTTLSPELSPLAAVPTVAPTVPSPITQTSPSNVDIDLQGMLPSPTTPTDITQTTLSMTAKPKPPMKPKPQLKPKPVLQSPKENSPRYPGFSAAESPTNVAKSKPPLPPLPKTKVFQNRPMTDASLDDIVQQELKIAQGGASVPRSSSVPNNMVNNTKKDSDNLFNSGTASLQEKRVSLVEYPECRPQSIGQSMFYTDVPAVKPAPSVKKRPPPRPSGPRPPPAPSRSILVPEKAAQPSVLVPCRAAPPRPDKKHPEKPIPAQRQKKPPGGDLMNFSPEKDFHPEPVVPENQEVIKDLERRIVEIEADIEKCNVEQRDMIQRLSEVEDEDERIEAQEKLEFYEANSRGLKEEHAQLIDSLEELKPQERQARVDTARQAEEQQRRAEMERQKAAEEERQRKQLKEKHWAMRVNVIEEIVKTEADYLSSLTLCLHTFFSPDAPKCPAVDLETLFCNMDQIIELSQCLLTSLEGATSGRSFEEQIIGLSFVEFTDDMKKAYSLYCCNHDEALSLLEKYEKNEEVQEYLSQMLELMKQQKTFFDLGSILIKPVQRILKYPLLLNELFKSTEADHPDHEHLVTAIHLMTEVAGTINELKHRKDLVLKYRKDADNTLSDKIARLTVHSAKKKFYRVTQKMVGVQKIDENFLREEKKFKDISLVVRQLVHDLTLYLEQLQDSVACAESVANDLSDYYAEKSSQPEVEQFCEVHNQIATSLFHTFRSKVDLEVMQPLNRLLLMFQGPMKVIKKRHDKELDFNKMSSRVANLRDTEQLKSMNEDLQQARRTYEALNAQLLDELPQLYMLTLDVLRECIARLAHSQKVFFDNSLQLVEQLLSLSFVLCVSEADIVEDFSAAHVSVIESLSYLSFLPKTFSPQAEEKKSGKGRKSIDAKTPTNGDTGMQTESQREQVTQTYPIQQLFTIVTDFVGQQPMDMSVPSGAVVGVIKEGDPMGNKDRWFVDAGAAKGFIPKKFLAPLKDTCPVDGAASPLTPDLLSVSDMSFDMSPSPFELGTASLDSSLSVPPYDGATAAPRSPLVAAPVDWQTEKSSDEPARDGVPETDAAEEAEYYRAVYGFEARCPIEVTLRDGMLIKVIESHDLDGNSEWWLVETEDGCRGYAPANYLYKA